MRYCDIATKFECSKSRQKRDDELCGLEMLYVWNEKATARVK